MLRHLFERRPTGNTPKPAPTQPVAETLTPEALQQFEMFSHLPYEDLVVFWGNLSQSQLRPGEQLFVFGDDDDAFEYLLCEGTLNMESPDGREQQLQAGSDRARCVVSSLRPRQYTATAATACSCIAVPANLVAELVSARLNAMGGSVTYLDDDSELEEVDYRYFDLPDVAEVTASREIQSLLDSFQADLAADRVQLTSIPEVALKVRKVIDDEAIAADAIASVIKNDPVIAAKLIKASNSAFYRGRETCDSVTDAVVRLGLKTTRQLVMSFTMRHLFRAEDPRLDTAMRAAWDQTVYTGAIAAVLASLTRRFEPEEAMLAAILSNIGVLSVFNYLNSYPDIVENPARLDFAVDQLKTEVGPLVLERWEFPGELVACAREGQSWDRQREGEADLTDLVITASLHAQIGRRKIPRIDHVPACQRLLGDELCPEFAMKFMEGARQDIREAWALFSVD